MKFRASQFCRRCVILWLALSLTLPIATAIPAWASPNARVTLRAQNEPVRAVLLRLAHQTGANIAVAEGVDGYVTLELHGVTLAQALRAILGPLGADYHLRAGVYDIEAATAGVHVGGASGPVVIPLAVVSAKRAAATVRPLFPQASLREDEHANALIVLAAPADVQAIRAVLQGIDVRDPTRRRPRPSRYARRGAERSSINCTRPFRGPSSPPRARSSCSSPRHPPT